MSGHPAGRVLVALAVLAAGEGSRGVGPGRAPAEVECARVRAAPGPPPVWLAVALACEGGDGSRAYWRCAPVAPGAGPPGPAGAALEVRPPSCR